MGGARRTGREIKESSVVVAVDATKDMTDYALDWAICNVVHANDTLVLLALIKSTSSANPNNRSGFNQLVTSMRKKWNLCCKNNVKQIKVHVKILQCAQINSVADKAEEYRASWVILDRRLKDESEYCSRELDCNIIIIDHSVPKILQLINASATKEEAACDIDAFKVQDASNGTSQKRNSLMSSSSNSSNSLGFNSDQDSAVAKFARELPPLKPTLQHFIGLVADGEQRDKNPLPFASGGLPRDNIFTLNNHQTS